MLFLLDLQDINLQMRGAFSVAWLVVAPGLTCCTGTMLDRYMNAVCQQRNAGDALHLAH